MQKKYPSSISKKAKNIIGRRPRPPYSVFLLSFFQLFFLSGLWPPLAVNPASLPPSFPAQEIARIDYTLPARVRPHLRASTLLAMARLLLDKYGACADALIEDEQFKGFFKLRVTGHVVIHKRVADKIGEGRHGQKGKCSLLLICNEVPLHLEVKKKLFQTTLSLLLALTTTRGIPTKYSVVVSYRAMKKLLKRIWQKITSTLEKQFVNVWYRATYVFLKETL